MLEMNADRDVILPVVLRGCETWSVTVREDQAEGVREWGAEGDMWG
jgi:hypothetical protein